MIRQSTVAMFDQCDFVASPTTPTPPFRLDEHTKDPLEMYLADLYTVQASLAGFPAISIPLEPLKNNLPVGLQVMAPAFEEQSLLSFAKELGQFKLETA